jgi:uncharacterized membrane protein
MSKSIFKSKVFWFNLLALVVLFASQFGYTGVVSPDIQGYVEVFMPAILLVVNIALRFVTKQPVYLK